MEFESLIKYEESDWLDFKQEWYSNNVNLILDILCMANSDTPKDRFIVIGYNEENRTFVNLSNHRKNRDDFFNTLRAANFNCMPDINLKTITIGENELDIIIIKKTNKRPYFLLKDKTESSRRIRAGVIYTRNGSSNTPIDSSASENQIADMWRERFGLNLSPKERLKIYLKDHLNWKEIYIEDDNNKLTWYYESFPEFTIEYTLPNEMKEYSNPPEHPHEFFTHTIGNSYRTIIQFKYHSTIIEKQDLYICDKQRFNILHPKIDYVYYDPKNLNDVNVFANNSFISDKGISIEDIDAHAYEGKGYQNQVRFCYNFIDSFEYYVQKIINRTVHDIYAEYRYFDSTCREGEENSSIRCPSQIYLFKDDEYLPFRLRNEFLNLQNNQL